MTALDIDLAKTPFSRRGSYFAVSEVAGTSAAGIFLRTVHGDARRRELVRIDLAGADRPVVDMAPGRLVLRTADAEIELALDGTRALARVDRGTVTLDFEVSSNYDVVLQESPGVWRYIASGANRNYRIAVSGGSARLESGWNGLRDAAARLVLEASNGPIAVVIDEFAITPPPAHPADIDAVAARAEAEFDAWLGEHGTPRADPVIDAATRLAAYITWSALVPPGGLLRRESMLMSKNDMAHIWSWDHCFNAIALARDPVAAADQLLTLFDHQDAAGGLPDHIDDARVQPNFTKPPIHGWAIGCLMDRDGLTRGSIAELYDPLARWTDWWFTHRVYGDDGVPSYNHGNDSGWDNSTVFAAGVPVQSPDLLAFLALQQATLARMADHLGLPDGAHWRSRAGETIHLLIAHFWRDGRFVARDTLTGRGIVSDSLLTLMPLVLGDLLPQQQFETCVQRLLDGGYLTERGIATEPRWSTFYESDGYWRGPVWAPTTMLLIDGLRRGGRADISDEVARRFVRTCALAGMAENFDAETGAGLRDGSMTWTASVYLTLVAELSAAPVVAPHPEP